MMYIKLLVTVLLEKKEKKTTKKRNLVFTEPTLKFSRHNHDNVCLM
jgi:hypothetical protein